MNILAMEVLMTTKFDKVGNILLIRWKLWLITSDNSEKTATTNPKVELTSNDDVKVNTTPQSHE